MIESQSSFYCPSLFLQFLSKLAGIKRNMTKFFVEIFIFFFKVFDGFVKLNNFVFHDDSPLNDEPIIIKNASDFSYYRQSHKMRR